MASRYRTEMYLHMLALTIPVKGQWESISKCASKHLPASTKVSFWGGNRNVKKHLFWQTHFNCNYSPCQDSRYLQNPQNVLNSYGRIAKMSARASYVQPRPKVLSTRRLGLKAAARPAKGQDLWPQLYKTARTKTAAYRGYASAEVAVRKRAVC